MWLMSVLWSVVVVWVWAGETHFPIGSMTFYHINAISVEHRWFKVIVVATLSLGESSLWSRCSASTLANLVI